MATTALQWPILQCRNHNCTAVATTALQWTQLHCSNHNCTAVDTILMKRNYRLFRQSTTLFLSFQTANAKKFFKQDMSLPNRMFEETDNVMFYILSAAIVPEYVALQFGMFLHTFESRTLVAIHPATIRNIRQDTNIEISVHTSSKMTFIFIM